MTDELKECVVQNFMFGASPEELNDDASLMETGVLDSTSVLELVLLLEEKYHICIDAGELVPGNLDSIDRMRSFLARKGVVVAA